MNTTTDTAATFTPNAVYSVPSLGIFYKIQFSEKGTPVQARIQDKSGYVTEWLPVVPVSNETPAAMVIDPDGYMIPVEDCKDVPQIKRPRRRICFRVYDRMMNKYLCAGYGCRDEKSLLKSMTAFFRQRGTISEHADGFADIFELRHYLRVDGYLLVETPRVLPFRKSHVYN